MDALVFSGPWSIDVETRPDPEPGPDEVVLQITATGICGSDVHGFTGENGRRHPGQVMGHETVGRIVAVGKQVGSEQLKPGQVATVNPVISCGSCAACQAGAEQGCPRRRVIGVTPDISSAMAEYMAAPARNVVVLPADMPEEHGALIEPLAVGYHAALRGFCGAEDRVLVLGGGPIGQACALGARRLGASRLVVSELNPLRRALLDELGLPAVDPTVGEDLSREVPERLGGPATLVLDAVGISASLTTAMTCSGLGARVVLVGMNAPRIELDAYAVSTEERSLIGSFCYSAADFRQTAEWVGSAPNLGRLIEGRVDLAAAPDAFAQLAKGESQASKILVLPHGVPPGETR